jgi:restriction system protein
VRRKKASTAEAIISLYGMLGVALFFSLLLESTQGLLISLTSIIGLIIIQIIYYRGKRIDHQNYVNKLQASDMAAVDLMTGREFELYLEVLFQNLGYAAEQLPTSKDFGADLILVTGDKRIAVQAKRYKGNVGNRAVQMILGAKRYYDCDEAWIVSNSFYTKAAIQMAVKTDVRLYDRNGLLQFMTMNQALPK